ncbi:Beta-lactamase [Enhygromyxa salina]|uniref:Beta-lactamase n=1 Tax=Enhygromyxa salina TaxID=215803 RepID=A0A0C1ZLN6_9BACT|nr:penicillin-binding transpeptidase domain-containing protein [Enhygromyxa salina]KIG18439.1 Beta-lactamase [Enhygromyxa salina]
MSAKVASLLTVAALLCSCRPAAEPTPPVAQPKPTAAAAPAITIEHRPALTKRITEAGYEGVFVVLDPATATLIVSDPELAEQRFIPASTFKIPNSLIALETGVADSPAFTLKWDGVQRWASSWNRDHDLRSAFAVSALWYYQELARRIGEARMAKWVTAANYGNADISGGIDAFWLNGALRISPREQVEFLQRLDTGASPFTPATVTRFLDEVMIYEPRPGDWTGAAPGTVRAKTGWARSEDFADPLAAGFNGNLGWFVGAVTQANGGWVYFATLLVSPEPAPDSFADDRPKLTAVTLRELGYLD